MLDQIDIRHKKILSILFKANGKLDSFTLFKRSRFSFAEFTNLIRFLEKIEYVSEAEYVYILTEKSKRFVLESRVGERNIKKWREVPISMLGNKIDLSEGYIPSKKMLDKEF